MPPSEPDVPSPCIGVCSLDPQTGWCTGCFRSIQEIAGWVRLAPADKRSIVAAALERRTAVSTSRA